MVQVYASFNNSEDLATLGPAFPQGSSEVVAAAHIRQGTCLSCLHSPHWLLSLVAITAQTLKREAAHQKYLGGLFSPNTWAAPRRISGGGTLVFLYYIFFIVVKCT